MRIADSILRGLTQPVLVLDGALRAVMANPAFYDTLKIVPGQLEGKSVQELIAPESGNYRLRSVLEALYSHDSNISNLEIECLIPPSVVHTILCVNARRVHVADISGEMVLVELRDVTRERESERRIQELNDALQAHGRDLEEINAELDSYTYSVSHDLRTPLRLTNKIAHMLLSEHGSCLSEGAKEKVHMILDSTEEMGKLIEDLLTFSQINREPMKRRRIDIRRLAREVADKLLDDQANRAIEIVVEDAPPVQGDRALLKQVILNLLANALKFTRSRARAEIRFGFTQSNEETVYFIRDNGIGFDMAHAESMFLVFHRLHKTHSFEGSGVGLALAKRIIERHGGRIWAEGIPDRGATFFFTIGAEPTRSIPPTKGQSSLDRQL